MTTRFEELGGVSRIRDSFSDPLLDEHTKLGILDLITPNPNPNVDTYRYRGQVRVGYTGYARYTLEARREEFEEVADNRPMPVELIEHGLGAGEEAYARLREEFALAGQMAATTDETGIVFHRDKPVQQIIHPEKPQEEAGIEVIRSLNGLLGEKNIRIRGLGHSAGGLAIVNMAKEHPEMFNTVTIMGSVGTSGHGLIGLVKKGPRFVRQELGQTTHHLDVHVSRKLLSEEALLLANTPRLCLHGLALSMSDLRREADGLRPRIKTAQMPFRKDSLFDANRTRVLSRDHFDIYEEFSIPEADHLAPQEYPKEVAAQVLDIQTRLMNKEHPKPRLRSV